MYHSSALTAAIGMLALSFTTLGRADPYDDFDSSNLLNGNLWGPELERRVDVVSGALRIEQRRSESPARDLAVQFAEPESIVSIETTVSILKAEDRSGTVRARLVGFFCDFDNVDNRLGNELIATIETGRSNGVTQTSTALVKCTNPSCSSGDSLWFDQTTFSAATLGAAHRLTLSYDSVAKSFQFGFDDQQMTLGPENVPDLALCVTSNYQQKFIGTRVSNVDNDDTIADEYASISATFDDIVVNDQPYDDFSAGRTLDRSRWLQADEGDYSIAVDEIGDNNRVRIALEHCGNADSYAEKRLPTRNPLAIRSLRADAMIGAVSLNPTAGSFASARGSVGATFYNDGREGANNTGDVFVEARLIKRFGNDSQSAECGARVCENETCSASKTLFSEVLNTWQPGQQHGLFVGFDETTRRLICGINDARWEYTVGTDILPARNPTVDLRTVISGIESNYCADVSAHFDNVEVNGGVRDTNSFSVEPNSGLQTSETGSSTEFGVRLLARPQSDVFVPLTNTRSAEGFLSRSALDFTASNWDTIQTVKVTGKNDDEPDGDWVYKILLGPTVSADSRFDGKYLVDVTVKNVDDEGPEAGLFLGYEDSANRTVCENGGVNQVAVKLTRQPQGAGTWVTVALSSDTPTEATIASTQQSLAFDFDNWNVPQFAKVQGQDDTNQDGDQNFSITARSTSNDKTYDGLQIGIGLTSLDNELDGNRSRCPSNEPAILSSSFE